jgi:hypothetical protein
MGLFFAYLISLVSTFLASVLVLTTVFGAATTHKNIYLHDSESASLGKHVTVSRRGYSKVVRRPEEKVTGFLARFLADSGQSVAR